MLSKWRRVRTKSYSCVPGLAGADRIGPHRRPLPTRPLRFKSLSIIGAAAMISAPLAASNAQYAFGSPTDVCGGNNFTFCFAIAAAQGVSDPANFYVTITN